MTDQQESMAKEILMTMRSIQSTNHEKLINIISRLVDETFQSVCVKYRVMLSSYFDSNGENKKIHAIKIMRKHIMLGLKDAKDTIDCLDHGAGPIVFAENIDCDIAIAIMNDLRNDGLTTGEIKKI